MYNPSTHQIIIVEGNYLLFENQTEQQQQQEEHGVEERWGEVKHILDEVWFVDVEV